LDRIKIITKIKTKRSFAVRRERSEEEPMNNKFDTFLENPVHNGQLVEIAKDLIYKFHKDQLYGNITYLYHLMESATVLDSFGFASNCVLKAAVLLHDIMEDTPATRNDLLDAGLPMDVIHIVEAVTDVLGTNRKERKTLTYPKIARSRRATIIKLADRIANVKNGAKNDMYRKEQAEFRAALYNPDHDLDNMWEYLELILEDN
jgi:(p)ppGpp synthase/HD superfamily hydrolase